MAVLDKGLKQRMVGALVLVALAVIFVPMLLSRDDEARRIVVDAPSMPATPAAPTVEVEPVAVPEPQPLPDEPVPADPPDTPIAALPVAPAAPPAPATQSPAPAPAPTLTPTSKPAESRLDANNLPVSWSVQLASLSNRGSAESLQATLRNQGYNAYIRTAENMNRVFVGPVIERAEAERLRDQLNKQQKLNGFVVRFRP
jgi:DedD protein